MFLKEPKSHDWPSERSFVFRHQRSLQVSSDFHKLDLVNQALMKEITLYLGGAQLASKGRYGRLWVCIAHELTQFSSVAQSCPTLCDPMDCSTPAFPVHHQLLELTQAHVHRVGDDIQQSHPPSSPSPPAFNLSQHQSLFKWVSSSHQVAKVLEGSFSISPSNEYPRLILLRIDWFDLLAVHRTL